MATEVMIHPFEKIAGHLLDAVRAAIEDRFGLRTAIGEELAAPAPSESDIQDDKGLPDVAGLLQ